MRTLLALAMTLLLAGGAAAEPVLRYVSQMGASLPPEAPVPATFTASDMAVSPVVV